MPVVLHHRVVRDHLGLGVVAVDGVRCGPADPGLASELDGWIHTRRTTELSAAEDRMRRAGRDMLRNGVYKPTGRGKPASEYLLRAAKDEAGSFPRINGPVDANNLISVRYCLPISVWDRVLAGTDAYELRLGHADESYVFNPTGQMLDLRDLICGCGLCGERGSVPMVTPIKDSLATKITNASTRLAACIYYPLSAGSSGHLTEVTQELLRWLLTCGPEATGRAGVCLPGQTLQL